MEPEVPHREVRTVRFRNVAKAMLKIECFLLPEGSIQTPSIREFFKAESDSDNVMWDSSRIVSAWPDYQLSTEAEVQKRFQTPPLQFRSVYRELFGSPVHTRHPAPVCSRYSEVSHRLKGETGGGVQFTQR
jgi:hypothetical protein